MDRSSADGGGYQVPDRRLSGVILPRNSAVEFARLQQVGALAKGLGSDWYIDTGFAEEAVQRSQPFNVIHMRSGHKFDLFPAHDDFHASELDRATVRTLSIPGGHITCLVATAEDIILAKLQWYRSGGESSERQWSDITGLLAMNPDLDLAYLDLWSTRLRVADLLQKAVQQAR